MEHVEDKLLVILKVVFWIVNIAGVLAAILLTGTVGGAFSLMLFLASAASGELSGTVLGIIIFLIAILVGLLVGIIIVGCNYIVYLCLKSYIDLVKLNRIQSERLTELCQKKS